MWNDMYRLVLDMYSDSILDEEVWQKKKELIDETT